MMDYSVYRVLITLKIYDHPWTIDIKITFIIYLLKLALANHPRSIPSLKKSDPYQVMPRDKGVE